METTVFRYFENLINPYPVNPPEVPSKRFSSFIWKCTEGMRGYLLIMMITSSFIGAFDAALFGIMGKVVDWLGALEPGKIWEQEGSSLILLSLIIISSIIVIIASTLIKHQTLAGSFPMRLRWRFHQLILNQSMNFFQDEFAGRVSAKVMQTALAVRDTWFILTDMFAYVLVYFVSIGLVIISMDLRLLPPFIFWLICYGISIYWFIPRLSRVAKNQADARSLMTGRITDAYTNISTVKLFAHAGREADYAQESMQDFMFHVNKQMRLITLLYICVDILNKFLILSSAALALWLWNNSAIGVGAVAASIAMAMRMSGMSQWIMWEFAGLFENVGTVQDGINTLTREPAITDSKDAKDLSVTKGEINFKNVHFSYGKKETDPVISNLNLVIKPGEKIGLVGRSGAGKSTLVNLLLRFYDLESGSILIDGQDISSVKQDSLRSQIGMVTQDTSLLHRSVRDNILYGRPDATEEMMRSAAKRAEADDFILTLSDLEGRTGYDAHVGERGVKLSGGQRQRIAISRVMLKDAPILLLDEATSALDSEVEAAIQESLNILMQGKTVIAIAHRLSTIAAMDRLIVLNKGKIIEEGDHAALLKKEGLYAKLWARQSGGFIGEEIE